MQSENNKAKNKTIVIASICMVIFCAAIYFAIKLYPDTQTDIGNTEQHKTVIINEISSNSQQAIFDEDGDYPDFIELYNTTDTAWDMTGWKITDSNDDGKYVFGSCVIEPGEYLLIFASGKDKNENGVIHLNFKLSEGEVLTLFGNGNVIVDKIVVPFMDNNVSYGRNGLSDIDTWVFYPSPTPGAQNFTRSFETSEESVGKIGSPIFISEIMPAPYEGEDYIELYNPNDTDISLAGYSISDSFSKEKYVFDSEQYIAAGSYKVIYADSLDFVSSGGTVHTNFKLNKFNEKAVLYYNNFVVDEVEYGYMTTGVSVGRTDAVLSQKAYFTSPSPGSANSGNVYSGYSPQVNFSVPSGCYDAAVSVKLSCIEADAKIYYTIDGSTPTTDSALYTEPLTITGNTPIRAFSYKEGRITSAASTANYVIGASHTLPVVFITTAYENMFGYDGIYKSQLYNREQIAANLTLVETDGSLGFSIQAYLSIHGNMSVFDDQKSFSVKLSERLGASSLKYNLFPDNDTRANEFASFLLRTGGNDWDDTQIKDGMLSSLASTRMDLDYQGFRPCVVYINGEYWGLYNIREKLNDDYLETYYGADKDNVDIISFGYGVHKGSYDNFDELLEFIDDNDLDSDENWNTLNSMMDVENMIDTYLCHIYYGNFDTVNIKWWRENTSGARWRWFLYDLDYALYIPRDNELALMTDPEGHGVGKYFSSELLYNLMKSDRFRSLFLEKIGEYWDNIFNSDILLNHWYTIFYQIAPELRHYLDRWEISQSHYLSEMNECYDFIARRPGYFRVFVRNYFGLSDEEMDALMPEQAITVSELDWWNEITNRSLPY